MPISRARRTATCPTCGGALEEREDRLAGALVRASRCASCGEGNRTVAGEGTCPACGAPTFGEARFCPDHAPLPHYAGAP